MGTRVALTNTVRGVGEAGTGVGSEVSEVQARTMSVSNMGKTRIFGANDTSFIVVEGA